MSSIDNLFNGYAIDVKFPAIRVTGAQGEAIRQYVGTTPPNKLRFTCLVAETLNEALNGGETGTPSEEYGDFEINGEIYRLNPKGRSQFGKNKRNQPYLTTSLVHVDTGTRYRFTWVGEQVDDRLKRLAVAHDEGESTRGFVLKLSLDDAEKKIIADTTLTDKRRNHDSGPRSSRRMNGDHRVTHGRVCRADLAS